MIRMEFAGPRGKASFSKQLGLSPSTYDYYESSRVPPAEILVKIADLAGVDLRWLLTGEESAGDLPAVSARHPAIKRVAELLSQHPEASKPLTAFLDILAATMKFPAKPAELGDSSAVDVKNLEPVAPQVSPEVVSKTTGKPAEDSAPAAPPPDPSAVADKPDEDWIPVLGRSAAGVPHFWTSSSQAEKVTTLGDLMDRHVAAIAGQAVHTPATQSSDDDAGQGQRISQPVQLIRLPEPITQAGPTEYVSAGAIKNKYRDAFAVWIDGDSMSPEIRHGDLVLLSPSAPAQAGRAAVVQLEGAIGVTCKLYHPSGKKVHLVPINEQFPPTTAEANQIQWSLHVLARIRLSGR